MHFQKLCPLLNIRCFLVFIAVCVYVLSAPAQNVDSTETKRIFTFQVKEMIAPAAFRTVKKAIENAEEQEADYIIMELNTYGGLVDAADSIRTLLMRLETPTIAWINNNAASAGALISIACDSIYMSSGANMGATTVVNAQGEEMPDKYQSYMRSTMRSTAEVKGRDPNIAEAMVDERITIPGVVDSNQILTFTTSEAIANNYCEGKADNLSELIEEHLHIQHYTVLKHKQSFIEKCINFLLHPAVNSLLMLMIMGGIWFELQSPGIGFPLAAAVIGAILFFAPLYLEGLAEHWEITLFIIGLLLLLAEVFVIPGFGVAGIFGIVALLVSLTFSLIDNNFFDFSSQGLQLISFPLFRVLLTMMIMILLFVFLGASITRNKSFQRLILNTEASKETGFTVKEQRNDSTLGKMGIVVNECKPFGRVDIDGEYFNAKSEQDWIERGENIMVIGADVNNLIVRKV